VTYQPPTLADWPYRMVRLPFRQVVLGTERDFWSFSSVTKLLCNLEWRHGERAPISREESAYVKRHTFRAKTRAA
jgi:hypothetical protein